MSAPNYTQADVNRICDESDEWVRYLRATNDQPAEEMDDVTRRRFAKHLQEMASLGRFVGGFPATGPL